MMVVHPKSRHWPPLIRDNKTPFGLGGEEGYYDMEYI